jgi:hypothetical protein
MGRPPERHAASVPLRKGLRVRLRPRKWTTEPTRRPPGVAMWDGRAGSEPLPGKDPQNTR